MRFRQWWARHFLVAELWASAIILAAFIVWMDLFHGWMAMELLMKGNRGGIYGALASIFGSLLGFSITALSIIVGLSGSEYLATVRDSRHYPVLFQVFVSTIRCLGAATSAALIGVLSDSSFPITWWSLGVLYLNVFTTTLAIFRIARAVWAMEYVVAIIARRSSQSSR